MTDTLTSRQPEQVAIGSVTLFCEKFKAVMTAYIAEKSTVSGENSIVAHTRRAARLILFGRIPSGADGIASLGRLGNMTGSGDLTVTYRGLTFTGCVLLGCTAEDSGDFISLTVTLSAPEQIQFEEG